MRLFFGLSIALNLFLLTTIVAARVDSSRPSIPVRMDGEQPFQLRSAFVDVSSIKEVSELLDAVQSTPLSNDDIKSLTLGWLMVKNQTKHDADGPRYWQAEYSPQASALASRMAVEQYARDALISVFGQAAVGDTTFASVFRPLGLQYDFLSSDEQIDLQRTQLELLRAGNGSSALQTLEPTACISDRNSLQRAPTASGLAGQLGDSAAQEYRMRFSPLAQQLRTSAVATGEQEYRALFDKFLELELDARPQAQARLRGELRARMGEGAFDRLWSKRDPFFVAIKDFLLTEGFPSEQIFAAYSVINRSQEALLRTMAQGQNPAAMMSAASDIRQDESAALTRLLGDRAATGLSIAMSEAVAGFSSGSNGGCRSAVADRQ